MYYGCIKEVEDKRDYKLYVCASKPSIYPEEYKIKMTRVKDQGVVNSCVAHALSSFLEETYKDDNLEFSTGFIYGYRPFNYTQGEGMSPRQAVKTLYKIGDVEENKFSHNKEMPEIKKLVDSNLVELLPFAELYKIDSYARIYTENEIKKCLFNNITVPISIPVYNDLKLTKDNIVKEPEGEIQGYHMILLYGWNEKGWLFQNSWGKYWGDNGRAILPFNYPIDSAWALGTENNDVLAYNTFWQKVYSFFFNLINKIKSWK